MSDRGTLGLYYDWLSRYQGLAARLGLGGGHETLTVHRLLLDAHPGVAPGHVVHERILAALGPTTAPRVIDAGCGAGGTIFFLHSRLGGQYDGLTISRAQRDRARREAKRRGLSAACRFHLRSYDSDLVDVVRDGVDLIVMIESLAHSDDPTATIGHLACALADGGRLAVVDDVPREGLPDDDPDFIAFREGWRCGAIAQFSTLLEAVGSAGLSIERDEDLTPLVTLRDPHALERLVRMSKGCGWALRRTPVRPMLEAVGGCLMLERLYHRGLMQYRFLLARRPAAGLGV